MNQNYNPGIKIPGDVKRNEPLNMDDFIAVHVQGGLIYIPK